MKEVLLNTLAALLVVGISGVVFGYLLSLASKFFAVKIDEKVEKCREVLPGANCGGCGYSGCAAYAEAVANGAPLNCCAAGGQPVADKLAEILGRNADKVSEKKNKCEGKCYQNYSCYGKNKNYGDKLVHRNGHSLNGAKLDILNFHVHVFLRICCKIL